MCRYKFKVISVLLTIIVLIGCSSKEADWAFNFVVWENNVYKVEQSIAPTDVNIDEKLGEVTHYSNKEGTYGNGFSNIYKAGTELYVIKDIQSEEAIAIRIEDNQFIKAINTGKYK